jgi:hypothetical protein
MKKNIIIDNTDIVHVSELPLADVEIAQGVNEDKVEIYMLDESGNRIEGGTFDRNAFINHVLKFYNDNY